MQRLWSISDLHEWDDRIREIVYEIGLDCYQQEFEVCDQNAMIGYMAYHGMPSHYPHWSFGKAFEQTKTKYDHGVTGLPYEMVINSDPSLAYLMRDNSLCLQILTIAHVYGHNDFFKNNATFTTATDARQTIGSFKSRADRVRKYIEDASIGEEAVEKILDAAHALSFSRSKNLMFKKPTRKELENKLLEEAQIRDNPFWRIDPPTERKEVDLTKEPLEPDEDLLLFIRDHNRHLSPWARDLLTIVDDEAQYFLPQIQTKVMNEGWASHWHHRIMNRLALPHDLQMEFMKSHHQVICPHPGGINPYHVGFVIWRYIESGINGVLPSLTMHGVRDTSYKVIGGKVSEGFERDMSEDEIEFFKRLAKSGMTGTEYIFSVRAADRDTSFINRFLTFELANELDLFNWAPRGEQLVVSEVADRDHFDDVKRGLMRQIGTGSMPTIKIHDSNYKGNRGLYMEHDHDGRDLDMSYADKTLNHIRELWGNDVYLMSHVRGKKTLMSVTSAGFDAKLIS